VRSDARHNIDALLEAAKAAFATSGVHTPVREIAARAGVGLGTVYRHFPQRSDLVAAVFRHELDACADAASVLAAEHEPGEALDSWLQRYTNLLATKRGLAAALHSEAPAFEALPACFQEPLLPALASLLEAAAMGRPLIATDVPGCRELVEDGSNGILCKARNSESLANAMKNLAKMPHARLDEMGSASRRLVEKRYSQTVVIGAYLDALGKLLVSRS